MRLWEIEEYLSTPLVLPKIWLANRRRPKGIEITELRYGTHPQQRLLHLRPRRPLIERKHVIFFVHGGWCRGSPHLFRFVGHFFAGLGYPTVLPGYRLAPGHTFPAQLEDVFAALASWREAFGDAPLILGGQSAGAQLASLMALHREEQERRGLDTAQFAGLFCLSGPLDFSACREGRIRRLLDAYLGHATAWREANPMLYRRLECPIPVLCIHGDRDPLVDIRNSQAFVEAGTIEADSRLVVVKGGHHADLLNLFLGGRREADHIGRWLTERELSASLDRLEKAEPVAA